MQFALQVELPVRIRPERPMTDEELMRFSTLNELLRVERDANGELIITLQKTVEIYRPGRQPEVLYSSWCH